MDKNNGEVAKLQNHLSLLRSEYVKLQSRFAELERKYAICAATSDEQENNFIVRILKTIADLYGQKQYSDLSIKLKSDVIPAHKFVLLARSQQWGVPSLTDIDVLDWSDCLEDVGKQLLKWVYTNQLDVSSTEICILSLIKMASKFCLPDLVDKCESNLISCVDKNNCIKFYMTAMEISAFKLKEHCSNLISSHWSGFTKDDFKFMSSDVLHKMLKSKSRFPLHDAIRIEREDVVFLYLVDDSVKSKLNEFDDKNDLPLDLSLGTNQESIAKTLVDYGADLNVADLNGQTSLHKAILRDDYHSVEFLLDHGASPSIPVQSSGETPFHLVCRTTGNILAAKKLLEKGANINAQANNGKSPLHFCVEARREALLKLLLESSNLDLESKTVEGYCALWLALKHTSNFKDENNFAKILVNAGASLNSTCVQNQNSLLHLCAEEGMEAAAVFLCNVGAKVNLINLEGESPLHFACRFGLSKLTSELLKCKADPYKIISSSGDSALHLAIKLNQIQCGEAILKAFNTNGENGDDNFSALLDAKDSDGLTPLGVALNLKKYEFSTALVESGSDVNAVDLNGVSLLNRFIRERNVEAVLFLIDHQTSFNTEAQVHGSPLFLAVENDLPVVVEALCKKGIDMSVVNADGDCILWVALQKPSTEIASILVRYGIDTDFWTETHDGHYETLLHRSIEESKEDIACFLIEAGCDINSPRKFRNDAKVNDEGATPLHLCATGGLTGIVACLLEHGVQANVKDYEGKTPLHIAIQNHHDVVTDLLLSHSNVDLSIRDKLGYSPFASAMIYKNNKAAQAILNKYPTAAEQYNTKGRNFLHLAIENKDLESVMFLLSIKINVNCKTKDSQQLSSLHLAVESKSELLVRNLLLAGANIHERTPQKYTALHIAAEKGDAAIVSVLLDNGADYAAVDNEHNNALNIAVKYGNYQVCKVLLMESHINAESVNLKGQNSIHLLARYGKQNVVDIFNLFLECMPDYPINKPDVDGNTPLLLAYINGNGELCRALVKAKACLGSMNKHGITIFNYQVPTRQLLYRLLDYLTEEPPWAEGDLCLECGAKFSITLRKHHCRHCGRLLCHHCSEKDIPIVKFNLNKPVRVCSPCFDVLALGGSMIQ